MLRWFILKKNSKAKKIISMDTGQDTKDTSRPVANIREERTNIYTRGVARAAYGSTTPLTYGATLVEREAHFFCHTWVDLVKTALVVVSHTPTVPPHARPQTPLADTLARGRARRLGLRAKNDFVNNLTRSVM